VEIPPKEAKRLGDEAAKEVEIDLAPALRAELTRLVPGDLPPAAAVAAVQVATVEGMQLVKQRYDYSPTLQRLAGWME